MVWLHGHGSQSCDVVAIVKMEGGEGGLCDPTQSEPMGGIETKGSISVFHYIVV
jgi:hypothetical protein